jgi:hypothetical protein
MSIVKNKAKGSKSVGVLIVRGVEEEIRGQQSANSLVGAVIIGISI